MAKDLKDFSLEGLVVFPLTMFIACIMNSLKKEMTNFSFPSLPIVFQLFLMIQQANFAQTSLMDQGPHLSGETRVSQKVVQLQ